MFSVDAIARDFSRAAATYDIHGTLQAQALTTCVKMLAPHLSADAAVMDAGCGTGRLLECGQPWNIAGIDIAPGMCEAAARRGMRAVCADVCALPFADGAFAGLVCSLVLQWVNDAEVVLEELFRVASPGGTAAICTFGEATLHELRAALGDNRVSPFAPLEKMQRFAKTAGWRVAHAQSLVQADCHEDMRALLTQLKAIGATNKLAGRYRGLSTPRWLSGVETRYREANGGALPVTWQLHWLLLRKA